MIVEILSLGNSVGCLIEYGKLERTNLPPLVKFPYYQQTILRILNLYQIDYEVNAPFVIF